MAYEIEKFKAPRTAGSLLRALAAAAEAPLSGQMLAGQLLQSAGVPRLRETGCEEPLPVHPPDLDSPAPNERATAERETLTQRAASYSAPELPEFIETAEDFIEAYLEGRATPLQVAERVIDHTRASEGLDPALRVFIAQNPDDVVEQARQSTERYERGEPLGPLDGVPVAVKDELDQVPYPTTVGTKFLGRSPVEGDSEVVARLRAAGAMLIGKANMQEIGLGVFGINPHYGSARNPYDRARVTGGSSSGSAAAVAAGLCPIAVGADGGGSIRIPAAFCSQVGLKATFGRISEHGAAPLCWSLAHVGPIAASVRDTALAYAVMAGPDPQDLNSLSHPSPLLPENLEGALEGVKLGLYRPWFEHADGDVVRSCEEVLGALEKAGAEILDVEIPELSLIRVVHLVTIVSEMADSQLAHYDRHRSDYGHDTRLNLALARHLRAYDYVHAQRLRVRIARHFQAALTEVDALVTPTTGCTAPILAPDAEGTGESNLEEFGRIMRFVQGANLTGLPAITVPAGYDEGGLPIGLQVMGRHWEEDLLIRLAAVAERSVERRRPEVHYRLLDH